MTKDELIKQINDIVEFLTNGRIERDNIVFKGHPAFYLEHSKEDFDKKLNSIIEHKNLYDEYDLYYYTNCMFKFMLNKYDSHTKVNFTDAKYLPIKIRFINNIPYIVGCSNNYHSYLGAKISKINDIDINIIIDNLKKIICYASNDFLRIMLEVYLSNASIINSLPIIKKQNILTFETDKGNIIFDLNHLDEYVDKSRKENYSLEIIDRTAIITYNSCSNEEKMIELIDKLNKADNIENYIVDLRGNGGGNSGINRHLIKFLEGKRIVALSDERVFSSAIMCLVNLKNIGAKIIGSNPGTPITYFGNNVMQKELSDLNLRVNGSATYWYYDANMQCHGIYKNDFEQALKEYSDLLTIKFINTDEEVNLTLSDYINCTDSVLDYAFSLLNKQLKK